MKKRSLFYVAMLLAADIVFINISYVIGYYVKYGFPLIYKLYPAAILNMYSKTLIFATFAIIAVFHFFSLYSTRDTKSELDESMSVFAAVSIASIIFEVMTLIYREFLFSRTVIFVAWICSIVFIITFRLAIISFSKWLHKKGVGTVNILVMGDPDSSEIIIKKINEHPEFGMRIKTTLSLSDISGLKNKLKENKINKMIFTVPDAPTRTIMDLIDICQTENVEFQFVPRVLEIIESRISTDELIGVPLISVREIRLYGFNAFLKRTSDVIMSGFLLILLSPIFLLVTLLIKIDSRGPIFFVQRRVGQDGKEFDMFKFRSMIKNAESVISEVAHKNQADGHIFKIKDDPRMTRVGRFLRKWSLDELPQIINVFRGEMSIVGPRPPIPREVEKYDDWHKKRLRITPGITGLWQVSGRSELSFDDMVKLDIYYIENWSLWLDTKILLKTIPVVLIAKGAY